MTPVVQSCLSLLQYVLRSDRLMPRRDKPTGSAAYMRAIWVQVHDALTDVEHRPIDADTLRVAFYPENKVLLGGDFVNALNTFKHIYLANEGLSESEYMQVLHALAPEMTALREAALLREVVASAPGTAWHSILLPQFNPERLRIEWLQHRKHALSRRPGRLSTAEQIEARTVNACLKRETAWYAAALRKKGLTEDSRYRCSVARSWYALDIRDDEMFLELAQAHLRAVKQAAVCFGG